MGSRAAGDKMIARLMTALEETEFSWSLCLIGEDQASKLAQLSGDLQAPLSPNGQGKQIASGFSYWGIEPSVAWAKACHDPYYPVMRKGIETFPRRWRQIEQRLGRHPVHYVSLGPGTGEKEQIILRHLHRSGNLLSYIPVDMSAEMLRMAVQEATRDELLPRSEVFPVQLDFSDVPNLQEFRRLLGHLTQGEPVLFAMLGNTLANFWEDGALLSQLAELLTQQDQLVLEVASTRAVNDELAEAAAAEYARSSTFWNFVTSTLVSKTNLKVTRQNVHFIGEAEDERAIRVVVVYRNDTGGNISFRLADGAHGDLFPDETIRLLVTRKYLRGAALDDMLRRAGLVSVDVHGSPFAAGGGARFGLDLFLLRRASAGEEQGSMPAAIWD